MLSRASFPNGAFLSPSHGKWLLTVSQSSLVLFPDLTPHFYSPQDPISHFSTKLVSSQVETHSHMYTLFIWCSPEPTLPDLWGPEDTLQNFNMAQAAQKPSWS